ncbi:hypothetical protein J5N97_001845 [Dioscorea zingiberensis]|uniref:Uncharacterized protein n=1 Tax=Dioscorea zingiberensis TaxID=325984 RepID=A0A9D5BT98_9LILI|nr:hypothetical protein J5N97_001845 [Dioscorea zingiberensis]
MSSLVGTHGMALATAMAVSGTVILFALCRPRPVMAATAQNPTSKKLGLRPCIYSSGAGSKKMKKKKKRVRFAEDVVVEFEAEGRGSSSSSSDEYEYEFDYGYGYDGEEYHEYDAHVEEEVQRMPANRVALYNGILQARMQQRIPCSY